MTRLPLALLLPAIASLVACGGAVASPDSAPGEGIPAGGSTSGPGGSPASSSSGGVEPPTTPDAVDVCTDGVHRPLAGVLEDAPAPAPNHIELRELWGSAPGAEPRIVDSEGLVCATAVDQEACKVAVTSATSEGWQMETLGEMVSTRRYALATRGDEVLVASSPAEVVALVGASTPAQAALAATLTGKYRIVCDGKPNVWRNAVGHAVRVHSGHDCGPDTRIEAHELAVATDGTVEVRSTVLVKEGNPNCAIGRKPEGLVALAERDAGTCADPLGRFFAEAAYLEAASVVSFARLARELEALSAPAALVAEALASRDDEVRHARTTSALARLHGAEVEAPEVAPARERSVFDIALENAVEGCVRETYGALVAHWQATHARDLRVRAALGVIAEDETRHAELSLAVASFLDGLLTDEERARVAAAKAEAIEALRRELAVEVDPALVTGAGMPRPEDALALLATLDVAHLRAAA